MSLSVYGVNHRTAPVSVREQLALNPETLPEALQNLLETDGIQEAVILSTCNRLEVYCNQAHDSDDALTDWIQHFYGVPSSDFKPHLYRYEKDEAVRHLLRVACGLDSMILGEPQILGQLKTSFSTAADLGAIGKLMNKLFQHSFSVAKQVRTDTAIGSSPVSVAFAAVRLAQQIFGELNHQTALLIGAGETIELAARHLHENDLGRMIIANRTLERSQHIASEFSGYAIGLSDIHQHLHEADIVISSTASQLPILGKGAVEKALKARRHKPMFMVDIAVPRDIEPEINDLDDVYLYTVDDLESVIEENLHNRRAAAMQADEIIDTQVTHFMDWMQSLDSVSVIRSLRQQVDDYRVEALGKARKQLARGEDPEKVMERLATSLCNKFTHQPTVCLREATVDGRHDMVDSIRDLFDLRDAD